MKNYGTKVCVVCKKEYRSWTSRQKTCCNFCAEIYKQEQAELVKKEKTKKILDKFIGRQSGQYLRGLKKHQFKIKDSALLQDYSMSPTGRAYIGVNKRPLQAVKEGFGYRGVLIQTDNREFVQCHVCGKWAKKLSGSHLSTHNLNPSEYKEKFGLMFTNGLVSDATSNRLEKNAYKRNLVSPNSNENLNSARANALRNQKHRKLIGTTEHDNKFGLCQQQLGFRLVEYIKKYKFLPSRSRKGEGGIIAKAMHRRFGSLNKAFEYYEVPKLYRSGSTVELVAPDKQQLFVNYNKNYNKDYIYNWIKSHSPVLQNEINKFAE